MALCKYIFLIVLKTCIRMVICDENLVSLFKRCIKTIFTPYQSLVPFQVHSIFIWVVWFVRVLDVHYLLPDVFGWRVSLQFKNRSVLCSNFASKSFLNTLSNINLGRDVKWIIVTALWRWLFPLTSCAWRVYWLRRWKQNWICNLGSTSWFCRWNCWQLTSSYVFGKLLELFFFWFYKLIKLIVIWN